MQWCCTSERTHGQSICVRPRVLQKISMAAAATALIPGKRCSTATAAVDNNITLAHLARPRGNVVGPWSGIFPSSCAEPPPPGTRFNGGGADIAAGEKDKKSDRYAVFQSTVSTVAPPSRATRHAIPPPRADVRRDWQPVLRRARHTRFDFIPDSRQCCLFVFQGTGTGIACCDRAAVEVVRRKRLWIPNATGTNRKAPS